MMDEETNELIQELVCLLNDTQMVVKVLRDVLIENELITQDEIDQRVKSISVERYEALKTEASRRSHEKILKILPKQ